MSSHHPPLVLTLGALQAGTLVSTALSGAVGFQLFIYWRRYSRDDPLSLRAFVLLIWAMDAAHTCLIAAVSWQYLILNFTNPDPDIVDHIFETIPATVSFTAMLTFLVNGYFITRVHKLSKSNWWFTIPTTFFLVARLGLAFVSTAEMVRLKSFASFHQHFRLVFTAGLSTSALTDILVSLGLSYYLRLLNNGMLSATKTLKLLVVFADHNGALTCIVAIASLVCWATMPDNLIFMALHFSIGKIYSNSLLATLNMRNYAHPSTATSRPMKVRVVRPADMQIPSSELRHVHQPERRLHPVDDFDSITDVTFPLAAKGDTVRMFEEV